MASRSHRASPPSTRCSPSSAGPARTSSCPADLYGGTYRLVDKVLSALGAALRPRRPDRPGALEQGGPRRDAADLGREPDQPAARRRRHRGRGGAPARRARGGRQHVCDPGQPAPARARRRLRRALDDQILGGHSDVVGGVVDRPRQRLVRAAAVRPERGRRRTRAVRLLPRPPRAADAAPADGGPRAQRGGGRRAAARDTGGTTSLARVQRDGQLPPSARDRDRRGPPACSRSPSRSAASSR